MPCLQELWLGPEVGPDINLSCTDGNGRVHEKSRLGGIPGLIAEEPNGEVTRGAAIGMIKRDSRMEGAEVGRGGLVRIHGHKA